MLYAKVILGLSVEGPFDYIVPKTLHKKIKVGTRVWVDFRTRRLLGYVVGLSKKTNIKNLKAILDVIDNFPILDRNMLLLTKELSDYYCCSWGEAIDTALPEALRKGKRLSEFDIFSQPMSNSSPSALKSNFYNSVTLVHDLDGVKRWQIYVQEIEKVLNDNKSVIVILPDIDSVMKTKGIIESKVKTCVGILHRKQNRQVAEWVKIKEGRVQLVIGTRSSIFAPFNNLGLVIIDEEQDYAYKQDQVPHYNVREVAFMRINIERARLIMASTSPSLETFYLARESKIQYLLIPREKNFPEIKIIDTRNLPFAVTRKNLILSRYLEDSISGVLNKGGKALLFLNRKGFATFISCSSCGEVLKCPRCNINLVYHFKKNVVACHYCNFKMQPPQICSKCNSGYIRYSGMGIEKIESELSRIFPQARIKRLDQEEGFEMEDADIFVTGSSMIRQTRYLGLGNMPLNFDIAATLYIDNSLNHIDFRSGEKTFALLMGLLGLTNGQIVIQTGLPSHNIFKALINKDANIFYNEELKQRKQLAFPPYKNLGLVKLRGKKESHVKDISSVLFEKLKGLSKSKALKIISVNPAQSAKLRGNFYWQILIRSDSSKKISKFLKIHLKDFSHSGIIVTVDIDPL